MPCSPHHGSASFWQLSLQIFFSSLTEFLSTGRHTVATANLHVLKSLAPTGQGDLQPGHAPGAIQLGSVTADLSASKVLHEWRSTFAYTAGWTHGVCEPAPD